MRVDDLPAAMFGVTLAVLIVLGLRYLVVLDERRTTEEIPTSEAPLRP